MSRSFLWAAVCLLWICCGISFAEIPSASSPDILLQAMQHELQRATNSLKRAEPSPYFLSYAVEDTVAATVIGTNGGLVLSTNTRHRVADVMMRVGTSALDNTHGQSRPSAITSGTLPLADDSEAIARVLWQLTNREYQQASGAFLKVKTNQAVQSEEDDKSPDFSQETPEDHIDESRPGVLVDRKLWEERVRRVSAEFLRYPGVYTSLVIMQQGANRSYLTTSEGTNLVQPSAITRLVIEAETRADDGMDLLRVESFQVASSSELPSESELIAKVDKIAADLKALRAAPVAEPYAGPALLSGRAAAVFFHEVLGHRLEGHRQRGETEGQTFTKRVNQPVLPDFLSVYDDPTLKQVAGVDLNGTYAFDDDGVAAQRVTVVDKGILKNFLLSRSPVTGFEQSNGHGRKAPGYGSVGRQGNLIVEASHTVSDAQLRQMLVDEAKKQGKQFGLLFKDISGGFTT